MRVLGSICSARAESARSRVRRGIAAVVMIIAMLMLNLVIAGMVMSTGRDQGLTLRRIETVQAFYAAEGGMNMAIRELMRECGDEDLDGWVGTISDDGNDVNDPTLGTGQVVVTQSQFGRQITLTSRGRSGLAVREVVAVIRDF